MKLIIEKFGNPLQEMELQDGKEYLLGRQPDCDVVLDCKAVISRKHLKIRQSEKQLWMIECISPLKGLYLEGECVDGVEMEHSAVLSFYEYTFKFLIDREEKDSSAAELSKEKSRGDTQSALKEEAVEEKSGFSSATRAAGFDSLNYFLEISFADGMPQHAPLSEGEKWIIGRGEECDIILEHKFLTKKHCELSKAAAGFQIKDLNSSNGTFLNGKKLAPNKPYPLKSQDIISAGEAEMIFKAKSAELEKISKNLPAVSDKEEEENSKASMAMPKVLLEDIPESEEDTNVKKLHSRKWNKKRLFIYGSLGLLGGGFFILHQADQKNEAKNLSEQEAGAKTQAIERAYLNSSVLMSQQKYALCVEELDKLHALADYYKDSKQMLVQCQNAVDNQKRSEEIKAREEAAEEVRKKVQALVEKCEKELSQFDSVEELNECLDEAVSLDPTHLKITEMQNTLIHKEEMRRLAAEKRQAFQKKIQRIRRLYTKAKGLKDKGEHISKTEAAYKKFLSASRNTPSLKTLHEKARREMEGMRQNYDEALARLYSSCERLIENSQMKEAYSNCLKVLDFKPDDAKALAWIREAKKFLRNKLMPVYRKSALEESLSNIEKARRLWRQILEEDVANGYYYKKAAAKLRQYK